MHGQITGLKGASTDAKRQSVTAEKNDKNRSDWPDVNSDETLEIVPPLDDSSDESLVDLRPGMELPSQDSLNVELGSAADELIARAKARPKDEEPGSGNGFILSEQSRGSSEIGSDSQPVLRGHDRNSSLPPHVAGYDVVSRIGQGSMWTVWRARELSTEREVAIKFLDARRLGSDLARARFEREVKLTARLEHPYIARVYTTGLAKGVYYYAMELVEGTTLERYVRREELSHRKIIELIVKVCEAVDYAHSCGVVHRDLKPSNIIINNRGEPRIVDFGLAKPVPTGDPSDPEATLSTEGQITGTPGYMSPEQAAGRVAEIDHRSDVYGVGAMLYKLLLQEYPHEQKGALYEVTQRIAEEDIRRPRDVDPTIDRDLEAILVKALARSPVDRYPDVLGMADDLRRYLSNCPVAARRLTFWYTTGKRLRKHRFAASLAGILIGIYLVTVMVLLLFVSNAQSSARDERSQREILEERLQLMSEIQEARRRRGLGPAFGRQVPPEELELEVDPLDVEPPVESFEDLDAAPAAIGE